MERRVGKMPASQRRNFEMAPPVKRKGPEMEASEHGQSLPAERAQRGEAAGSGRKASTTAPQQQRPTKVSPREAQQNQSDRVKIRTPPVVGKQGGGFSRKGPPSRPAEERNHLKR
jgi:hypothetical protein